MLATGVSGRAVAPASVAVGSGVAEDVGEAIAASVASADSVASAANNSAARVVAVASMSAWAVDVACAFLTSRTRSVAAITSQSNLRVKGRHGDDLCRSQRALGGPGVGRCLHDRGLCRQHGLRTARGLCRSLQICKFRSGHARRDCSPHLLIQRCGLVNYRGQGCAAFHDGLGGGLQLARGQSRSDSRAVALRLAGGARSRCGAAFNGDLAGGSLSRGDGVLFSSDLGSRGLVSDPGGALLRSRRDGRSDARAIALREFGGAGSSRGDLLRSNLGSRGLGRRSRRGDAFRRRLGCSRLGRRSRRGDLLHNDLSSRGLGRRSSGCDAFRRRLGCSRLGGRGRGCDLLHNDLGSRGLGRRSRRGNALCGRLGSRGLGRRSSGCDAFRRRLGCSRLGGRGRGCDLLHN